jgi:hypothetical protein
LVAAVGAVAALATDGCTDPHSSIERLLAARSTLQWADSTAAQRHVRPDLLAAHDKLLYAEQALSRKDYDIAERLAEKAEMEATVLLALSLIEQEQSDQAARGFSSRRCDGAAGCY